VLASCKLQCDRSGNTLLYDVMCVCFCGYATGGVLACVCFLVCVCLWGAVQLSVDVMEVDMGERGPVVSSIRVLQNVTGDSHVVRHSPSQHGTAHPSTA